ncbi:MAG: helix-turn-helix domain-containing protein [Verrucomicrobiales bacterium]|nr:helix-turn-helix domain-containing protein [Verrucomicrobiales bacterium]
MNASHPSEDQIYQKLANSPLFQTYRTAFTNATGMALFMVPADEEFRSNHRETTFTNSFCRAVNGGLNSGCEACVRANRCLFNPSADRPETTRCFAGMRETSIPIRAADQTVAFLRTGQVFTEKPSADSFSKIRDALQKTGETKQDVESLREKWEEGRVLSTEEYEGLITILAAFALQLSDVLNRLLIEDANSEPDVVVRAKRFVNANLEEKIRLEEVAQHVGVSSFYFCKVFKQATGMTLTEYVNRRRVEWAKRLLLNPQARVTEVAFDVGYQSLSQFNRSFLKYVGISPTRFREKKAEVEDVAA